jgi:hypothetical protein
VCWGGVIPPREKHLWSKNVRHTNRGDEMTKNIDYYMRLPYTMIINPYNDESGFYYVGYDVPEPIQESNYSGMFNVRIPKSLHLRLAVEAEREGVSLNQYALYKLSN